ncbi:hypothetical protein JXB02_04995 [Candidatus Woesearchaeota archaeon]|nr:hypothetical protein [Candidatus Woesearchaeota archaeon]
MADAQPAPLYEFKASFGKAMAETLVMIIGAFILILAGAFAYQRFIGIELIAEVLEPLGIDLTSNIPTIQLWFLIACGFAFILAVLAAYFRYANVKVKVFADRLVATSISSLVFTRILDVPFIDITSVIAEPKGLFWKDTGSGTVRIALANMKEKEIAVEHVHACQQVQQYLVQMLQRWKSRYIVQDAETQRREDIVGRMQSTMDDSGIL